MWYCLTMPYPDSHLGQELEQLKADTAAKDGTIHQLRTHLTDVESERGLLQRQTAETQGNLHSKVPPSLH